MRTLNLLLPALAVALLPTALALTPNPYTVTTLAGSPIQAGLADGTGSAARFNKPGGAVTDASGNVYIADTGNNAIRMITPGGVVTTVAGSPSGTPGESDGPAASATFDAPTALAIDASGNLYVADSGNFSIRKVSFGSGGATVSTLYGIGINQGSIDGIAVTPDGGTVYFSDKDYAFVFFVQFSGGSVANAGILVGSYNFDYVANVGLVDGTGQAAELVAPAGLLLASPTLLYVADDADIRAISISGTTGTIRTVAGDGGGFGGYADGSGWTGSTPGTAAFSGAYCLAMDASGDLIVGETGNMLVRKVSNPSGTPSVTTLAGSQGSAMTVSGPFASARFNTPSGIAIDSGGKAYIVDTGGNVVRTVSGGSVVPFAGDFGGIYVDGASPTARFGNPAGTAVDAAGNIYVADGTGNTIRKVTPGGLVTTLAGVPGTQGYADGPGTSALFNQPLGVAVDASGDTLWVADSQNGALRKISVGAGGTTVSTLYRLAGAFVPSGVAADAAGDVFIADENEDVIWEYTGGSMIQLAGALYSAFGYDGVGSIARFHTPIGITCNPAGTVLYVADQGNFAIRKVAVSGGVGTVTTAAGQLGTRSYQDGPAAGSYCGAVWGVAMDAAGNVYFTDPFSGFVREIDTTNTVTTLAGTFASRSFADGTGGSAQFNLPLGVSVDTQGNLYLGDYENFALRKASPPSSGAAPQFVLSPSTQNAVAGNPVIFTASASGTPPPAYQWTKDGAPIAGATGASLTLGSVQAADSGTYAVTATNASGSVQSTPAILTVYTQPVISNGPSSETATEGASATFGVVASALPTFGYQWYFDSNPIAGAEQGTLTINGVTAADAGTYSVTVSNLAGFASASATLTVDLPQPPVLTAQPQAIGTVGSFLSFPVQATHAPVVFSQTGALPPGLSFSPLTGSISGVPSSPGVYPLRLTASNASGSDSADVTLVINPAAKPVNLSVRGYVGPGAQPLTVGWYVGGIGSQQTLIRAVGPTLATFGVTGVLPDPSLSVFNAAGSLIGKNAQWGGSASLASAFAAVGAFPLPPASKDSAILLTQPTGAYSAQVTGASGDAGAVLVEVYDADAAAPTARLTNISGLALVGGQAGPLVAGFVVSGSAPQQVLLRAVGPTLSTFGLSQTLQKPVLTLFDSAGSVVATQAGWGTAPSPGPSPVAASAAAATAQDMASVGAFALPAGSADCALVVTLPPGQYSANVTAPAPGQGYALFELYVLGP